METKVESIPPSDKQMIDSGEGLICSNCCCSLDCADVRRIILSFMGFIFDYGFYYQDAELLDHLAAKCRVGNQRSNMYLDKFIITLQEEGGICYTHPENLPGIKKDGSNAHYFHKSMNAYASGKRKRRKIQSEDSVRWHKTGKTKPVMENGVTKGHRKILVLYTTAPNNRKAVKSNWVMHQYHLGTEDDENEGEFVVSKVFYQQKNVKVVDNLIAKEESVHPDIYISSPRKQEENTKNDWTIDIVKTPAQEVEAIKTIPHTSPSRSQSITETEFPSWSAGEICKPSLCKEDMLGGIAGMTEEVYIRVDSPMYPDFFEELQQYLDGRGNRKDEVLIECNDVTSHSRE
nr:PREDICTED: NAC domain-containing protein 8-like isoform X1 [Daucus carota subsp. sativus]XP_017237196.1 PREDICTED: NAC domain-containing protein 8-like isoform X1 [Daucus carota subsp. sativus]XP_017237197.1 PREDICTED: NAC domain-containing protein 8-like isoform X1 [Daucus carota subsp. sativus]